MILRIIVFQEGPNNVVSKQKCIHYIEKGLFMVIFYITYTFFVGHNTVFLLTQFWLLIPAIVL